MTHLSYTHLMCRVTEFDIVAPYTLRIVFDDAAEQIIDFEPILRGELYGPLRDPRLFNQVALDTEAGTPPSAICISDRSWPLQVGAPDSLTEEPTCNCLRLEKVPL